MQHLRRCANLALALLLIVFAVAPHQHEGFAESFGRDTVTQVGPCEGPQTPHIHAAELDLAEPCVACARQHAAGVHRPTASAFIRQVSIAAPFALVDAPAVEAIVFTPLRGPPA